jgi:hypothetical protein
VGSIKRRVELLEAKTPQENDRWEIPPEVQVLCKEISRERARIEGRRVPCYTPEELEELYKSDCETAAGGGAVGWLRSDSRGWKSPEAQAELEAWQEAARRRCARIEAGESLSEVYEGHDLPVGDVVDLTERRT